MASPKDIQGSLELSRVSPVLQEVHQRRTQKSDVLQWEEQCKETFEKLRTAVTTAPVLHVFQPDKAEEIEVHVNAS